MKNSTRVHMVWVLVYAVGMLSPLRGEVSRGWEVSVSQSHDSEPISQHTETLASGRPTAVVVQEKTANKKNEKESVEEKRARISRLHQSVISKDLTPTVLKQLKEEIENPSDLSDPNALETLLQATVALGQQLVKLYDELEQMSSFNPRRQRAFKPIWNAEELRKMVDENLLVYLSGLERLRKERTYLSFLKVTRKVKPSEALAKELLDRLISHPDPYVRRVVLSLVASVKYSEANRNGLIEKITDLAQRDADVGVQDEAVKMLISLRVSHTQRSK